MSEPGGTDGTDELLRRTLGHEAVWAEPPAGLEDEVVGSIERLAPEPPRRSRSVSWRALAIVSTVTAVVAVAVAIVGATVDEPRTFDDVHDLVATALAPDADARVEVTVTPVGTKLVLDMSGLAPAGPDEVYEGWMLDGDRAVSAGTFHLRGRDVAAIELWAGVTPDDFDRFAVTLHPIDGPRPAGAGIMEDRIVLEGPLR